MINNEMIYTWYDDHGKLEIQVTAYEGELQIIMYEYVSKRNRMVNDSTGDITFSELKEFYKELGQFISGHEVVEDEHN